MHKKRVIVVGGGSAGMVAAIAAARGGAAVTVLERMGRIGKKLLATGNGRCNLTNSRITLDRYHGERTEFARSALERFGLEPTLRFFSELGIVPREEEAGKIFPRSGQASAVLDLLRHELARLDVQIRCEAEVSRLALRGGGWEIATATGAVAGAAVVLATGGKAGPHLGSNGSGYELARVFGHRIVEPFPALTRIRVNSPFLKHLKGVKVEGTAALILGASGHPHPSISPRGRAEYAEGEILFTENGLSGPPILDLSRRAGEILRRGGRTAIRLDLCPEIPANRLPELLRERFAVRDGVTAEFALVGFLHKRLIGAILRESGVADTSRPAATLGAHEIRALAVVLKGWSLEVTGTDSWMEAQVTAGGIDGAGVDPSTLESRKAPGLYFAGELLDIDGDCGGYNLQWAWSSGHVAGTSAAERAAQSGRLALAAGRK